LAPPFPLHAAACSCSLRVRFAVVPAHSALTKLYLKFCYKYWRHKYLSQILGWAPHGECQTLLASLFPLVLALRERCSNAFSHLHRVQGCIQQSVRGHAPTHEEKVCHQVCIQAGSTRGTCIAFAPLMAACVQVLYTDRCCSGVQQDVEAVRKEIDFLTHIKHPNIIRLYEVYENTSEIFLVLELYVSRLLHSPGVLPSDLPRTSYFCLSCRHPRFLQHGGRRAL
jgi:hypothetical protein